MAVEHLKPVERGYNRQVVSILRRLLERAEAGDILSIMYLAERPEKTLTWGCSGTEDRWFQLAAAARMMHEIQSQLDDSESDSSFAHAEALDEDSGDSGDS